VWPSQPTTFPVIPAITTPTLPEAKSSGGRNAPTYAAIVRRSATKGAQATRSRGVKKSPIKSGKPAGTRVGRVVSQARTLEGKGGSLPVKDSKAHAKESGAEVEAPAPISQEDVSYGRQIDAHVDFLALSDPRKTKRQARVYQEDQYYVDITNELQKSDARKRKDDRESMMWDAPEGATGGLRMETITVTYIMSDNDICYLRRKMPWLLVCFPRKYPAKGHSHPILALPRICGALGFKLP